MYPPGVQLPPTDDATRRQLQWIDLVVKDVRWKQEQLRCWITEKAPAARRRGKRYDKARADLKNWNVAHTLGVVAAEKVEHLAPDGGGIVVEHKLQSALELRR